MSEGPSLPKPPVVVLAGVRWDFLWQRHHEIARLFARNGYPTVFVETTGLSNPKPVALRKVMRRVSSGEGRKVYGELEIYSPKVLPPTWKVFRSLNRRYAVPKVADDLLRHTGGSPVVVAYPPTRTTLDLLDGMKPSRVLYDCSDEYRHFRGVPGDILSTEQEILDRADVVTCTSGQLLERISRTRPDALLSGPAVDTDHFVRAQEKGSGVVGYVGHLGDDRLDPAVFRRVADAGFAVRIFGEATSSVIGKLRHRNIRFEGHVPHPELPAAISGVDVFVMPYREIPLTRGIFPAKTYELLATGRPIVSARLPSLTGDPELCRCLRFASTPQEFAGALVDVVGGDDESARQDRLRVAEENTWETRFRELESRLFPEGS